MTYQDYKDLKAILEGGFGRTLVTHNGRTAIDVEQLNFIAKAEGLDYEAEALAEVTAKAKAEDEAKKALAAEAKKAADADKERLKAEAEAKKKAEEEAAKAKADAAK